MALSISDITLDRLRGARTTPTRPPQNPLSYMNLTDGQVLPSDQNWILGGGDLLTPDQQLRADAARNRMAQDAYRRAYYNPFTPTRRMPEELRAQLRESTVDLGGMTPSDLIAMEQRDTAAQKVAEARRLGMPRATYVDDLTFLAETEPVTPEDFAEGMAAYRAENAAAAATAASLRRLGTEARPYALAENFPALEPLRPEAQGRPVQEAETPLLDIDLGTSGAGEPAYDILEDDRAREILQDLDGIQGGGVSPSAAPVLQPLAEADRARGFNVRAVPSIGGETQYVMDMAPDLLGPQEGEEVFRFIDTNSIAENAALGLGGPASVEEAEEQGYTVMQNRPRQPDLLERIEGMGLTPEGARVGGDGEIQFDFASPEGAEPPEYTRDYFDREARIVRESAEQARKALEERRALASSDEELASIADQERMVNAEENRASALRRIRAYNPAAMPPDHVVEADVASAAGFDIGELIRGIDPPEIPEGVTTQRDINDFVLSHIKNQKPNALTEAQARLYLDYYDIVMRLKENQ